MTQVFIGIGSNLNNPKHQVVSAIEALEKAESIEIKAVSPWYESLPVGPPQPNYINGVAEIETDLTPEACLDELQAIEQSHHRVRKQRWGARTLDLDILLWGDKCIHTERLIIPHQHMLDRAFVLIPLSNIAPNLVLPNGQPLGYLAEKCDSTGLVRLESTSP